MREADAFGNTGRTPCVLQGRGRVRLGQRQLVGKMALGFPGGQPLGLRTRTYGVQDVETTCHLIDNRGDRLIATHTELLYALGGGTGHMRLGVFPVVVPEFLPRLYAALQSQWPGLTIELREAVELQLLDQLSKGEIDGIIGRIVMENLTPDLRHEAVYTEPTVIVCGTHHPLLEASAEARVTILEQTAWMLPARQGAVYNLVASRLAQFGIKAPRVEIETTSVFATIEMLNHTNLLSILPEKIARDYQANQKVAVAPIDNLGSNYPIGVIYRADAAENPLVAMLLKTTRTLSTWPSKH